MPDRAFGQDPFLKEYVVWASCYDAWTRTLEHSRLRTSAELDLANDLYCDIATCCFEKAAKVVPVTIEGLIVYISMLIKFEIYGSDTQIRQAFETIELSLDHLARTVSPPEGSADVAGENENGMQAAWPRPSFSDMAALKSYVGSVDQDELFDDRDQTTAVLICIVRSLHGITHR
ncbi:hypothetical protein [Bosea sp. TND4EK4]|uniref:hypothetical protein n=1 Tax=Bosea sp. TND4EK4 TaxID=1907408 RepID=UPI00095539FF|nr:hypothetical protein [Bosea sp. TND4EK4]SIQ75600.1 hypothetical protein SAMN05880592_105146 [Bosea sp. TND4EK4]